MSKQTVGDVISEYRGYAFGLPANYRVTMTWGQFREILNHIERVWKREREATDAAENVNSEAAIDTGVNKEKKPLRNFDRFNAAADAIDAFQDKSDNSLVYSEAWNEFICWLFSPAEKRKGETDGK